MSPFLLIPLHLLLLIISLIVLSRLLGFVLGKVLSAVTKFEVYIRTVTFWSVDEIVVKSKELDVHFSIKHISIVNKYFASSKRLFGVFFGDITVTVPSLSKVVNYKSTQSEISVLSDTRRQPKKHFNVPYFVTYIIQRLHFRIASLKLQLIDESVSVLVYLSTGANLVSCIDVKNFVSTHLILDDIQIKAKKSSTTYLNTSFGIKCDVLIAAPTTSINPVEHVRIGIKPWSIIIYEGIEDVLKQLLHTKTKANTIEYVTQHHEPVLGKVCKFLPYFPKLTMLCVENVSCSISDLEQTRNMSFKLDRLKEKGTHEKDNISENLSISKLEIFINHTPCINISSFKITPLTVTNIRPGGCDVNLYTLIEVPKLQWFNTELITWLTTLPLLAGPTTNFPEINAPASRTTPNISVTSVTELINLSVDMFEDSKTMKKIISFVLPRFKFHHSKVRDTLSIGLEVKTLQLELPLQKQSIKQKIKSASNTHIWGDVMFIKSLTLKLQKTPQKLEVHIDTQNMVIEWSYHLSDLIMEIMPQFITLIPSPPVRSSSGMGPSLNMYVESKIEKLNLFLLADDPGEVCTLFHVNKIEHMSSPNKVEVCVEDTYVHLLESLPELYFCNIELDPKDMMMYCKSVHLIKRKGQVSTNVLDVRLYWEPTQHRVMEVCCRKTKGALLCIRDLLMYNRTPAPKTAKSDNSNLDILLSVDKTSLHFKTSPQNEISVLLTPLTLTAKDRKVSIVIQEQMSLNMDSHQIILIKNISLSQVPNYDVELKKSREMCPNFSPSNKAWCFAVDQFKVHFPYEYKEDGSNFAMAVDEAQNCYKMLKAIHRTPRLASDGEALYADCRVVIKLLMIEFEDYNFDVKISHNYMIMRQARMDTFEKLSSSSSDQHQEDKVLNLSAIDDNACKEHLSIWEEYYDLQKQFKAMQQEQEEVIATMFISDLDLCVCADESLNGHDNVVDMINELDYDTTVPRHIRFTTLWGRWVNGSASEFNMSLRNFPSKLWTMNHVNMKGLVCGAEAVSPNHAIRKTSVKLNHPWKSFELARGMNPLKFFYNLHFDMEESEMCWGPCLEPTYQFFGQCMDKVTKKSRDPSPILPFWDKMRLLMRGDITYTAKLFTCKLLSEREPANAAEYLSICSHGFVCRHSNGSLVLDGDTIIKNSTESKYGECKIVTLPHLNILIKMIWKTINNNPNNHWFVTPYDPECAEYLRLHDPDDLWDSYADFRSKWLDMDISINFDKTDVYTVQNPKVNVYSHTFKWLRSWATVMGSISRPVFKGSYWKNFKPPKKKLARHYRKIQFRTEFDQVEIELWSSYRKRAGAKLAIESGVLKMTQKLQLIPWEPIQSRDSEGEIYEVELKRRPRIVWSTESCSAKVHNIQGTLKGTLDNLGNEGEGPKDPPEHFLFSISHVEYRQKDDKTASSDSLHSNHSARDSKLYTHWVNINDVKASLNLDTRSLILTFLEQYESSRALRCDLSAEALKTVNFENNSFANKRSSKNIQFEKSPNQSNDDLLSQWDPDTITIVTVDDRSDQSSEKLAGEQACSDYDIKSRQWSIQMTNGQMAVQGPDLKGFLILTTGKCQVLGSEHKPVLRGGEFFSKFSWVCIVEHVQYFATVDEASECDIPWLDENIISVKTKRTNSSCGELSSDNLFTDEPEESLKSIVREVYRHDTKDSVTQLQRIVSRCGCLLSFATYGIQPMEDFDGSTDDLNYNSVHSSSELLSAFSLRHKSLEVSTNSHQYKMIIDCVNNLILRTEGSKRSSKARLQHAIRLMESGEFKAREDILKLQDQVRDLLTMIKESERHLYEFRHETNNIEKDHVINELANLKQELTKYRIQLRLTISAFKEYVTNNDAVHVDVEEQVEVRKSDICVDEANWSLTAECGQIPIMEVTIRDNFIYSRTVYNTCSDTNLDFSSRHTITLGYFAVRNLQNKCEYRDVLFPKNHNSENVDDRHCNRNNNSCLRVFLSQRNKPVGGININDHLEINLVPLVLNFETALWHEIQKFFLGRVKSENDEIDYDDLDDSSSIHPLNYEQMRGSKSSKKSKTFGSRKNKSTTYPAKAIDEMAARSARKFFNFVKIQEIPILISYKGGRISVKEKMVQFPRIELSEQAYTWKELCLEIKKKSTPQIALSLGKMSKQKYGSQIPALSLLDNTRNTQVDEDTRDQYIYKVLMGTTDDQPPKKKKGFMTDIIRKKSKKSEKSIPQRPSNAPDESFAKECANPGEWEDNSLGERISELAAMSDESNNLDNIQVANVDNSHNLKNQLG